MNPEVFVATNLLALVGATLMARLLRPRHVERGRALAVAVGFGTLVLVLLLVLGSIGELRWQVALMAFSVLVLGLWGLSLRLSTVSASEPANATRLEEASPSELRDYAAVALLGGLLGSVVFATCILGTRFSRDDLSYHAAAIAQWLVDERISLAPFNYHAYYPYNAEILPLWWMLPSRTDAMASLSGLYATLLIVLSTVEVVAARVADRSSAFVAAALILVARPVSSGLSFSSVDLFGAATVLAALAFAVPASAARSREPGLSDALYCGLSAGMAVGAKIIFAPAAAVLLVYLAWGAPNRPLRRRAACSLVFLMGCLFTGAYWYVRNIALSGNPLFPAQWGPLTGPFSAAAQARTKLIWWILAAPLDLRQWAGILKSYMWWPDPLILPVVVGYGLAIRDFVSNRAGERRRLGLLLTIGFVTAATHPFMPFSGTTNDPEHALVAQLRYMVLPFAIGILLFGRVLTEQGGGWPGWWALAIMAVTVSFGGDRPAVVAFAVVATAAISVKALLQGRRATAPRLVFWLLVPATLVILALWMPSKQRLTDATLWQFEGSTRPIGAAWKALEGLPAGARIAWFGPFQYYPVYGRRLQFVPVPVAADGTPHQPLHLRWRQDPAGVEWWPRREGLELDSLVENLRKAQVDFVLVTRYNNFNSDYSLTDVWPQQQAVLSGSKEVESVFNDGYSIIWRLAPQGRDLAPPRVP